MKQILQNLKTGRTSIEEVPMPNVNPGQLKIKTTYSLISAGTERMLVNFSRANLIEKGLRQPEKLSQALKKMKTDGVVQTVNTVMSRLDEPQALGYSNVGVVIDVGQGVSEFNVGDRVISNGRHAEIVVVPKNLCAKIPDNVSDESAAFTIVSSIGLQGVRLAQPTLGESFIVYGLGLIGLLTAQILQVAGCKVLGLDVDKSRVQLADEIGITAVEIDGNADPISIGKNFGNNLGVDGVLITASTKDDTIIHNSAQMCRKRGRIILIGVVDLKLDRSDFYEKEISFQVSCSYGPGRYDPFYEDDGNDYPLGFVRWTEKRNFEAILDLMAQQKLITKPLESFQISLAEAAQAYDKIVAGQIMTALIKYPNKTEYVSSTVSRQFSNKNWKSSPSIQNSIAIIGSGNFTKARMLPVLKNTDVKLHTICSSGGISSASSFNKYGFINNTTDPNVIWKNDDVNTVFIATRHNSHGSLVVEGLRNGKHLFVEKPLTIFKSELDEIAGLYSEVGETSKRPEGLKLMVGFNRRFSSHAQKIRAALRNRNSPISATYLVNAGFISSDHWTQKSEIGGGRVLGECCHFIDLLSFFVGAPVKYVTASSLGEKGIECHNMDTVSISLEFFDGSIGTIHYFCNGAKSFPKERIEIFSDGNVLRSDNFRCLNKWDNKFSVNPLRNSIKFFGGTQDKGHELGFKSFLNSIKEGAPCPIPFEEIIATTKASFAAQKAIDTGEKVELI